MSKNNKNIQSEDAEDKIVQILLRIPLSLREKAVMKAARETLNTNKKVTEHQIILNAIQKCLLGDNEDVNMLTD